MSTIPEKNMTDKVCLITGGNSGIGKETAVGLAKLGANVVIVSRNMDKGEAAILEIKSRSGNQNVSLLQADLSSIDSVRELADDFRRHDKKLHILINNAGVYLPKHTVTEDGLEATFATNHLGHFLLTNLLLDLLKGNAPSRIINVTSSAHQGYKINFDDLQSEKKYSAFHAYGQSKLANILFTYQLAKKLEGTGVTANCLHPGVVRTGFGKDQGGLFSIAVRIISPFMMSPEKAARAAVYLATAPELENVTGKHYTKGKEERSSKESYDEPTAERLWQESSKLTGLEG
jgi:NAD(P)-dependent dehydrogenase (short-subunit alcohol dehydrogenase family)